MAGEGRRVALEYSVSLEDGTQIDTNVGDDPLVFMFGSNQIFPALEQEVIGMKVGEVKKVVLEPDQAYGPIVPEAFREVDINSVPPQFRFVGAVLGIQDPAGGVFPIRVHQINQQKVVLDFNHPLAGRTLCFDIKVLQLD